MASSRLLLLLIGVISFHLPQIQAGPTDFWCNTQARKNMDNKIEGLKKQMVKNFAFKREKIDQKQPAWVQICCPFLCSYRVFGYTQQNGQIKLSVMFMSVLVKLQQKRAEVVGALQMFYDGVQHVMNKNTLQCQTPPLTDLGHHITNYLAIIDRLHIQDDPAVPSASEVQICSSQNNLNKILEQFRNLLRGKLERLALALHDHICREQHRTSMTM